MQQPHSIADGRYELLEELGHGGMGSVLRGYDSVLDRPVAVKLIRPEAVASPHLAQEFVKRFQREARVTARIQHPGVPQVYDAGLDDALHRVFLVMELVDGMPLSACVQPGRQLPVGWAASVAAQIATALSHAHNVPVIHRDLKPSNILLARDGTVKVLDFGIAAILRTDVTKLTATGNPIGTYQYMSPEQVRGGRVSPQSDLYALGCLLHELLSGRPLFEGNEFALMNQHVNAAPIPLRRLRAEVPEELEALVLYLLRKAPESRPADTQELYGRLLPFLPRPGDRPSSARVAPEGVPDPTVVFRQPYAPRSRPQQRAGYTPTVVAPQVAAAPAVLPEQLREEIRAAHAHCDALLEEERFAQAGEVLSEVIERASKAVGSENRRVLALRQNRAAIQLLGGDYRAALPEFDLLADAFARTAGPTGPDARFCRAQAARCRAELGQVTDALAELNDVLAAVRTVDGDVSEEAVELRDNIGRLLLAQGRTSEARDVFEPLHQDMQVVFGPDDEMTADVEELLRLIRLDLEGPSGPG